MTDINKIEKKIKKLLGLAGSSNEHEAAAAAARAHKLALEHGLSLCQIEDDSESESDVISEAFYESGRMASWKGKLAYAVAGVFNCSLFIQRHIGSHSSLNLVGTQHDIASAKVTIEYLFEVVERLTKQNAYGQGSAISNGYRHGLIARLVRRLKEQAEANKEEVKKEHGENVTALVLRKDQKIKEFLSNYNLKNKAESKAKLDANAYQRGINDADKVSLNRQVDTKSKKMRFKLKRHSSSEIYA